MPAQASATAAWPLPTPQAVDGSSRNYAQSQSGLLVEHAQKLVDQLNAHLAKDSPQKARASLSLAQLASSQAGLITLAYTDTQDRCNAYLRHIAKELKSRPDEFVLILDGIHPQASVDELITGRNIPHFLKGVAVEALGLTRMEDFYVGASLILDRIASQLQRPKTGKNLDAFHAACDPLLDSLAQHLAKGMRLVNELNQTWKLGSDQLNPVVEAISGIVAVLDAVGQDKNASMAQQLALLEDIRKKVLNLNMKLLTLDKSLKTLGLEPHRSFREAENASLWNAATERIATHRDQGKTVLLRTGARLLHSGVYNPEPSEQLSSPGVDKIIENGLGGKEGTPILHLAFPSAATADASYDRLTIKADSGKIQTDSKVIAIPPRLFDQ